RPLGLGGSSAGLTSPAISSIPLSLETAAERARRRALVPELLERARRHPYVRLALNGSFSALWTGQLISLFGDRMHQIALAFLVLTATNSPLAVGLVVLAATLPNLLLGPIAGTFVDRWDHKETMVVSDLLRASAVLIVPMAVPAISTVRRSTDNLEEAAPEPGPIGLSGFLDELRVGWRFLRHETVLLANTLQGAVGQFTIGVLLTLTISYARDVL